MTTILDLIDRLKESYKGQIFLVNLEATLTDGFERSRLIEACEDFAQLVDVIPGGLPSADDVARGIGQRCTSRELWRYAVEPSIERFNLQNRPVLTRVITYGSFFSDIMRRGLRQPYRGVPDPKQLDATEHTEVDQEDVPDVRRYIDSGAWKRLDERTNVDIGTICVWVAPLAELLKREPITTTSLPEFYRDLIGLVHLRPGMHLIRLDFNLSKWPGGPQIVRRRPHGAGNGGSRFRLKYDGPCTCNWGRTVNLDVLAKHKRSSMNGVPEMLLPPFSIPKVAIDAHYIGEITRDVEQDDEYFLRRLTRSSIDRIVDNVKEKLS